MGNIHKMALKSLSIQNFRCFKQFNIDFADEVTVLIGKNGTGKTTLIDALRRALSFVFSKDERIENPLSRSAAYLNLIDFNDITDAYFSMKDRDYQYPISIAAKAALFSEQTNLEWSLTRKMAGDRIDGFLDAYHTYIQQIDQQGCSPLFMYYSDSYPHLNLTVPDDAKELLNSGKQLPRNFAYYDWEDEAACSEVWKMRFIDTLDRMSSLTMRYNQNIDNLDILIGVIDKHMALLKQYSDKIKSQPLGSEEELEFQKQERQLQEISEKIINEKPQLDELTKDVKFLRKEIEYIAECLRIFSQSEISDDQNYIIGDMGTTIRGDQEVVTLILSDSSRILFDQLPAGYKRLYSIVFDIAYRAFLLNGSDREKVTGTVIIDEIDLHLHPSLEQEVVQRFKRTFPNLQLIITTHSPLVISNFKKDSKNKVLKLTCEDQTYNYEELPDIYGVDYSTSVRDGMDVDSTPPEIEMLKDQYFILLDQKEEEKAQAVLNEIARLTGGESSPVIKEIEDELKSI